MEISIARLVAVFGTSAGLFAAGLLPASSRAAVNPPWVRCAIASNTAEVALEHSLSPAKGAEVPFGAPVTFFGELAYPITFSIASSPAMLSNPDIDGGLGSAQPALTSSWNAYTFTSTKAADVPRTVYWQASFSNAGILECAEKPSTISTEVRTLTILPPPPPPVAQSEAPPLAALSSPFQATIRKPIGFSLRHPGISYGISCSSACSIETSYEVFVIRADGSARKLAKLSVRGRRLSLHASEGGEALLVRFYRGEALRTMEHLVREGRTVEARFLAKTTGRSGEIVVSRRRLRWRV